MRVTLLYEGMQVEEMVGLKGGWEKIEYFMCTRKATRTEKTLAWKRRNRELREI